MQLAHIKTFQAIKLDRETTYVAADDSTSITLEGQLIIIKTPSKTVITSIANMCWAEELVVEPTKESKNGQSTSKDNTGRIAKKARGKAKLGKL